MRVFENFQTHSIDMINAIFEKRPDGYKVREK